MIYIHTYKASDLSNDQLKGIFILLDTTWPDFKPNNDSWEKRKRDFLQIHPNKQCHVLFDEFEVIGYAETFERTVSTNEQKFKLMGLGSVCISEEYRGKGLGADIIKVCFGRVSHGEFSVCLFQTCVPQFYDKLDCKRINNKFVNSKNMDAPEKNPFWDGYTMVHPAAFDWPSGTIDLLGPGF